MSLKALATVLVLVIVDASHIQFPPGSNPCIMADLTTSMILTWTSPNGTAKDAPQFSIDGTKNMSGECSTPSITVQLTVDSASLAMMFLQSNQSVQLDALFTFEPHTVFNNDDKSNVVLSSESIMVGNNRTSYKCDALQTIQFSEQTVSTSNNTYSLVMNISNAKLQAFGLNSTTYNPVVHDCSADKTTAGPTTDTPTTVPTNTTTGPTTAPTNTSTGPTTAPTNTTTGPTTAPTNTSTGPTTAPTNTTTGPTTAPTNTSTGPTTAPTNTTTGPTTAPTNTTTGPTTAPTNTTTGPTTAPTNTTTEPTTAPTNTTTRPTTAPTNTTTEPHTTETPTTATPTMDHPTQNFTVHGENDTICLYMVGQFQFVLPYPTNGTKMKEATIGIQNTTDGNSTCATHDDELNVEFDNMKMVIQVTNGAGKKLQAADGSFWWKSLDLTYTYTELLFPGVNKSLVNSNITLSVNFTNDLFKAGKDQSYLCNSQISTDLGGGAQLITWDLQYKAFSKEKTAKFSEDGDKIMQCTQDAKTSSVVPIAVGAALAGLVVIVLIAYLIGRRRNRKGYESV